MTKSTKTNNAVMTEKAKEVKIVMEKMLADCKKKNYVDFNRVEYRNARIQCYVALVNEKEFGLAEMSQMVSDHCECSGPKVECYDEENHKYRWFIDVIEDEPTKGNDTESEPKAKAVKAVKATTSNSVQKTVANKTASEPTDANSLVSFVIKMAKAGLNETEIASLVSNRYNVTQNEFGSVDVVEEAPTDSDEIEQLRNELMKIRKKPYSQALIQHNVNKFNRRLEKRYGYDEACRIRKIINR